MHDLPILSCDGCGLCCEGQVSPPGYQLFTGEWGQWSIYSPDDDADFARFQALPDVARAELDAHAARVMAGTYEPDSACIWHDPVTRKCRWYEHRPQICRDYEMGRASCLAERERGKAACGAVRAPGEGAE